MHSYKFRDLKFYAHKDKLMVYLYKIFFISKQIDENFHKEFCTKDGVIYSDNKNKLNSLVNEVLIQINNFVINSINSKRTKYININSGLPLIGHNAFGIVDRNTNWIEIKPLTGCNLDCIFCSVDENKRQNDFVVEVAYLIQELFKLVDLKKNEVAVVINAHGEPMLYVKLNELISRIKEHPKIRKIILITNGTLLTKKKINELESSGLDQINISLNSISNDMGKFLSNRNSYDTKKIIDSILYIKNHTSITPIITPVYLHNINDNEVEEIVKFGTKNKINIAIQNFLEYKTGKRPTKQISFEQFYKKLHEWETKYNSNLTQFKFEIKKDKVLELPFKKNQIITVEIRSFGRFSNEMLGVTPGINRVISVFGSHKKIGEKQKVRIIRVKHNIFAAEAL